jgi:ribose transport system permease protein
MSSDPSDPTGGSAPLPTIAAGPARRRRGGRVVLYRYAVVLALLLVIALFSALAPGTFPTAGNARTIINSQAILLVLSLGLTLPLITGDFDLSIGATMGLAGALVAVLSGMGLIDLATVLLTLAVCAVIGIVNGFLIVRAGLTAFIATLATGTVIAGLTLYVSAGTIVTTVPLSLETFAQARVPTLGIGMPAIVGFGFAIVLWYLYEHTPLGRRLYFVGEGREAARLTGLPVGRLRILAFIGASLAAGVAGLLLAGQLGGMSPSIGPTFLLPAYAAAFLGSTTIKPGRFNSFGTVIGLYLLVVGVTGLELLGVESWVEQVFNGVALALAVAFARLVSTEQL